MADKHEAFLAGYDAHADALFRFALSKISDRETAKDALQEAFAKTWEYVESGHTIENMRAFLYKTLNNVIIDIYRKKKSVSLDALQEDGFDPPDELSSRVTIDRADGGIAMQKLRELPPLYRDAVFLRFVNELELWEIAEITGESENTISVRIHRGIKKLKELYDPVIDKN